MQIMPDFHSKDVYMGYIIKKAQMKSKKEMFRAFRIKEDNGRYNGSVIEMPFSPLAEHEIRVKVHYSSLNFKDALSASGNKGVTKTYPHTPGIDAVGTIEESDSDRHKVGDKVIVTSYDLGMNTDGGFADYIRVPSEWAVALPDRLSMKEAMIYGTAGFTAGMSILKLTESVQPQDGYIVISGATGGVGSLSVAILSKLGYSVIAITGKESEVDYLKNLGAKNILYRNNIENFDKKPLLKTLFAGAIDTVGGVILENIIKSTRSEGVVTCCGNVASPKLDLTVFPFILRGVSLIGIDSQNCPMDTRKKVWKLLADKWKPGQLSGMHNEINFDQLKQHIEWMLNGKLKRRTVLNLTE